MPTRLALGLIIAIPLLGGASLAGPPAAGAGAGAWVVASGSRAGAVLLFLPAGSDDARAHPAASFPDVPIAITCQGDSAFLLLPRRPSNDPDVGVHPARLVTRPPGSPSRPRFERPRILAPLTAGAEIVDTALAADVPLVLRRGVTPTGPQLTIEELRGNRWRPVPLPGGASASVRTWLLALEGRPVLAQQIEPTSIQLWTLDSSGDGEGAAWTERTVGAPGPIDDLLAFPAGPRAVIREPGTLGVHTLVGGRFLPAHRIGVDREGASPVAWNDAMALFWHAGGTDSAIDVRLLSADSETLYDGPLSIAGPVSSTEVQILIVLLCSVFFTAVVFMLRPEARPDSSVDFPPNASLASPARRGFALMIDLLPGLGLAYLVWFGEARSFGAVASALAERGAAPILALAALTIALTTIGEATTGRTLGKAITRCRTISYTGERPRWRQALARNTVKVLCPPIGLFVLLAPSTPQPGSFQTLVIVDHPAPEVPGSEPPPGGPRDRSDRS